MHEIKRVSKHNKCPVCGREDWCSVIDFGDKLLVLCYRVASNESTIDGGYKHWLASDGSFLIDNQIKKPIASLKRRDQIYNAMVDYLLPSTQLSNHLAKRGVKNTNYFFDLGYTDVENCIPFLLRSQFVLDNVPGFYLDDLSNQWDMLNLNGFFIPIRNEYSQIKALQCRNWFGDTRYIWFSTPDKQLGASSGAPIHFARLPELSNTLLITESALKADIVSYLSTDGIWVLSNYTMIGTAGVCAGHSEIIEYVLTTPLLKNIILANDCDWKTNLVVRNATTRLADRIQKETDIPVKIWHWDGADGLDDCLLDNREIKSTSFDEWRVTNV